MKQLCLILLCFFPFTICAYGGMNDSADTRVILTRSGLSSEHISGEWKEALRSRMSEGQLDSFARLKRGLTEDELAWRSLIESKTHRWNGYRDSLAAAFRNIVLPDTIIILLGYLGVDDAFTYENRTVCLDLTALFRAYGKAGAVGNEDRIDRIFAHEYTHLLHKTWAKKNNYKPVTFKDEILWECFYEGFGMYRSLNARWLPVNDSLPEATLSALAELYPLFVDRMIAIWQANELSANDRERLRANLSRGPVNKKWGAFPVAIWLLLEARGDEKKLSPWIDKGPVSVIELARKHLPAEMLKIFLATFK